MAMAKPFLIRWLKLMPEAASLSGSQVKWISSSAREGSRPVA